MSILKHFGLMRVATHEAEIERRDDEISRLRGARMMDAETIRQKDERHKLAAQDLEAQSREIAALRTDAEKFRAKATADIIRAKVKRAAARAAKEEARSFVADRADSIRKGARRSNARFKLAKKGAA